jgi:hypothetical protein
MKSASRILTVNESPAPMERVWIDRLPGGVLITTCLVASLSSIAFARSCVACGHAHTLAGGLPLGWVGASSYAALLLAWILGWSRVVRGGLALTGGTHIALIAALLGARIPCVPCWVTGLLAIAGAVTLVAQSRRWAGLAIVMGAAALCMMVTLNIAVGQARQHAWNTAMTAGMSLAREPIGRTVHLVIFERKTCEYCRRLRERTLPTVFASLANPPIVDEREASSEMSTPTLVLLGRRNLVMVESPSVDELLAAIKAADSPNLPLPAKARALGK